MRDTFPAPAPGPESPRPEPLVSTGRAAAPTHRRSRGRSWAAALAVTAVLATGLASGAATVPSADGPPGRDLGREVLPPGDGWASEGAGTTGGAAADEAHVHTVRDRAELVDALADGSNTPNSGSERDLTGDVGWTPPFHGRVDDTATAARDVARNAGAGRLG